MATYICEIWNSAAGGIVSKEVEAESYRDALKQKPKSMYVTKKAGKIVQNAEELLYEMDAKKTDLIQVKEGFNSVTTYSREEVENSLKIQNSNTRFSSKKILDGVADETK